MYSAISAPTRKIIEPWKNVRFVIAVANGSTKPGSTKLRNTGVPPKIRRPELGASPSSAERRASRGDVRRHLHNSGRTVMKRVIIPLLLVAGFIALSSVEANAVVCARGVYRAGCVAAPRAAVVVRRPVVVAPRAAVRRRVY